MAIRVGPISPRFGAEVSGIDITKPLDAETQQQIRDIQDQWGVTVWRDTGLDDASHVAFSRIFGLVELAPKHEGRRSRFTQPELFDASNLDADGNIVDSERTRQIAAGNRLWHSDSSFMPILSSQALLLCHEAPPEGGQTWFADSRSAYDDLPQDMKDRLEGLVGIHSYFWSRRTGGLPMTEEEIDSKPSARHPVVRTHKSGRKAIFVGSHTRDIEGMSREEGRALIKQLVEWCTQPQYVISVTYKPGDMTIWDNLSTLHRGGEFDDRRYRRDMRRTTVRAAEEPQAVADDQFTEMFRAANRTGWSVAGEPATVAAE